MKSIKIVVLAVAFLAAASTASAGEGFRPIAAPGYTWGTITFPSSVMKGPEENNLLLQGKIEQGIDWVRLGSRSTFNTFVDLGYSVDNNGIDYNNKITPGIGAKIKQQFGTRGGVEYGVRVGYENRWESRTSGTGVQLFVNYYTNWNLRK